jgi:hypothetical protein
MADMTDQPTFGLDKVLEALRHDLLAAQRGASAENVGLAIKETEVELSFTVEAKAEGGGKLELKVFGIGLGGGGSKAKSDSSVHRIKITLTPLPGSDRALAGGQRDHSQVNQDSG